MIEQLELIPGLSAAPVRGYGRRRRGMYAAPPGTGPAGETCGTCRHAKRGRRWAKCALTRGRWTMSYGTDIKLRMDACSKWERAT